LKKGLVATQTLFASVRPLCQVLQQVAHVLANADSSPAETVRVQFAEQLRRLKEQAEQSPELAGALTHFLKVTTSYAPHLFFCYQVADLPRTNNDLEQAFGRVRAGERRATGRRGALPGLVVRGSVRLMAALASRLHLFSPEELIPHDLAGFQALRAQVFFRQEARCKQLRFRKDPLAYLTALELQLS
jgi:hypothetical protein